MTMRFSYQLGNSPRPVISLGGRVTRPRPLIEVGILGPMKTVARHCLLDTGADDTTFPETLAEELGIDLSHAPTYTFAGVGGRPQTVRYAQVSLRVSDGQEFREWQAWVGFVNVVMIWPLLGFAGFLQYFTATFHGDDEEVELAINTIYPGT